MMGVAKMSARSPLKSHPGKPSGSCVLVGLIEDKANVAFEYSSLKEDLSMVAQFRERS